MPLSEEERGQISWALMREVARKKGLDEKQLKPDALGRRIGQLTDSLEFSREKLREYTRELYLSLIEESLGSKTA